MASPCSQNCWPSYLPQPTTAELSIPPVTRRSRRLADGHDMHSPNDRPPIESQFMSRDQQLSALMEAAAARAVKNAFESIGLGDTEAKQDLAEMRSLIDAYRTAKQGIIATFGKMIAMAVTGAIASYFWFRN